jgi:cell division protein FtsI (penicillin-binding protein 3)
VRLVERRIGLLFALFLLLLGAATARATWIGTVKAGSLGDRALQQQVEDMVVHARRGSIIDRTGMDLAVSEDAVTVFAHPFLIKNPTAVAARVAPLLGVPEDDLLKQLADRTQTFVYLKHKIDASVGHKIDQLGIEGIDTVIEPKRSYPQGYLASQVLGMVGAENTGLAGLEYSQEDTLGGDDGHRRVVKDAIGQPVALIETKRAEEGEDIKLTLDAAIQERVEAVLGEVGQAYQPAGATAVVMDPRSGAILALANWPRVDANDPDSAPDYARQDRAIQFNYEPGSTFKAFTIAGALEEGLIRPDTMLHVPFELQVADRTIGEAHEGGNGDLTVEQILARSSNVGSAMIGLKLGSTRFDHWVRRFGFAKPTGVDLPGEQRGIVLDPKHYSGSTLGNMSIGQGLSVTPIQMAAGFTAIANGGVKHEPYIVQGDRKPGTRVLSKKTATEVASMLEGVLGPGGTAQEASVDGYTLAGKTGTAEKPENGTYSKTDFVASFIGFAPARNPRLLVSVMVDEPRGDIYGGTVAAPAFERIMEFALPYLKIPPE